MVRPPGFEFPDHYIDLPGHRQSACSWQAEILTKLDNGRFKTDHKGVMNSI